MFIDTHAHLDFPQLRPHLESILFNANLAQVTKIITVGIDADTNRSAIQIAAQHEEIYVSIGWHPHEVQKAGADLEQQIKQLALFEKVVAIGEIGLDYYRDLSPRNEQKDVFIRMIKLASELDLPVIVHCRQAFSDVLDIFHREATAKTRGVFHCFSGDEKTLREVLDLGFFISFTGNITYKNTRLSPIVESTPIDRLLLETDCPFMTPHPHRGKNNEPAYIPLIAAKLSEIKKIPLNEIANLTSNNAYNLFKIK